MKKIFIILLMLFLVACSPTHNAKTKIELNKDMQSGKVITTIEYPKHEEEKHQLSDIKKKVDDFYKEYKKPFELNYKSSLEGDKIVFTFGFDFKNLDEYNDKMEKLTGQKVNAEFSKSEDPFNYYEEVKGYGGQLRNFISAFEKAFDNKKYFEEKVAGYLNFNYEIYYDGEKSYNTIRKDYPLKWVSINRDLFLTSEENKNDKKDTDFIISSLVDSIILTKDDALIQNLESGFFKDYFIKKIGFEVNFDYKVNENDVILNINYENISLEDLNKINSIFPLNTTYAVTVDENNVYKLRFNSHINKNDIENKTRLTLSNFEFKDYNKQELTSDVKYISKNQVEISNNTGFDAYIVRQASILDTILSFVPWVLGVLIVAGLSFFGYKNRDKLKTFIHNQKDKLDSVKSDQDKENVDFTNSENLNASFDFKLPKLSDLLSGFIDYIKDVHNWIFVGVYLLSWFIEFVLLMIVLSLVSENMSVITSFLPNNLVSSAFHILAAGLESFGSLILSAKESSNFYGSYISFRFLILVLLPIIVTCIYIHNTFKKNNKKIDFNLVIYVSVLNTLILSLLQTIVFRFSFNFGFNTSFSVSISFLGNLFFGLIVNFVILYLFYLYENNIKHFIINLSLSLLKSLCIFSLCIIILMIINGTYALIKNGVFFDGLFQMLLTYILLLCNIFVILINSGFGLIAFFVQNNHIIWELPLIILTIISVLFGILISCFIVKKFRTVYVDNKSRQKIMIGYVVGLTFVLYCFGNLASLSMSMDINGMNFGINLLSLVCGLILQLLSIFIFDIYYDKLFVDKIAIVIEKILSLKLFNFKKRS